MTPRLAILLSAIAILMDIGLLAFVGPLSATVSGACHLGMLGGWHLRADFA